MCCKRRSKAKCCKKRSKTKCCKKGARQSAMNYKIHVTIELSASSRMKRKSHTRERWHAHNDSIPSCLKNTVQIQTHYFYSVRSLMVDLKCKGHIHGYHTGHIHGYHTDKQLVYEPKLYEDGLNTTWSAQSKLRSECS